MRVCYSDITPSAWEMLSVTLSLEGFLSVMQHTHLFRHIDILKCIEEDANELGFEIDNEVKPRRKRICNIKPVDDRIEYMTKLFRDNRARIIDIIMNVNPKRSTDMTKLHYVKKCWRFADKEDYKVGEFGYLRVAKKQGPGLENIKFHLIYYNVSLTDTFLGVSGMSLYNRLDFIEVYRKLEAMLDPSSGYKA